MKPWPGRRYHVWLDRGESWTQKAPPKPDVVVEAFSHEDAATRAFSDVMRRHVFDDEADLVVYDTVDDRYWLVEVGKVPQVHASKPTTLYDLCEDDREPVTPVE